MLGVALGLQLTILNLVYEMLQQGKTILKCVEIQGEAFKCCVLTKQHCFLPLIPLMVEQLCSWANPPGSWDFLSWLSTL